MRDYRVDFACHRQVCASSLRSQSQSAALLASMASAPMPPGRSTSGHSPGNRARQRAVHDRRATADLGPASHRGDRVRHVGPALVSRRHGTRRRNGSAHMNQALKAAQAGHARYSLPQRHHEVLRRHARAGNRPRPLHACRWTLSPPDGACWPRAKRGSYRLTIPTIAAIARRNAPHGNPWAPADRDIGYRSGRRHHQQRRSLFSCASTASRTSS